MAPELTPQQLADLDVARSLAAAGIPVFIAPRDDTAPAGFRLPTGWQRTLPDPRVLDHWRPGMAVCAVMGHGLDLLDVDPRNGGDAGRAVQLAHVHGAANTPSGGAHLFIASLGVGSRDGIGPGLDFKGGHVGEGHGFAFLAPTVKASKVDGRPAPYTWAQVPQRIPVGDTSGAELAARIRAARADHAGLSRVGGPQWWQEFATAREPQSAPAAERAINEKVAEVRDWTSASGLGFRTTLLRAALTLGGYVGGGYLDEDDARARLGEAVAHVWGTPDGDDELWITQGITDGTAAPFRVLTEAEMREESEAARAVAGQTEQPPPPPGADSPPPGPPWSVFRLLRGPFDPAGDGTDQGLAKAVAAEMYPWLRYAQDSGQWIKRGETVWEEAGDDLSDWAVTVLAEAMPLGATPVPKDPSERTEMHWQAVRRNMFMSSAGAGKIARKLRAIVRSDHPATLRTADLDLNPEVLWAGAVPWDLRRSGDVPTPAGWVDPNTPHLRSAACAPDPTVPTPRWDAFTAAVLPDPEVRAWALRVLSIALTGYADAALPVLYGRERSGKTSLIKMLVAVLGSYGHAANPKLLGSGDGSHDVIVYELKGRRLSFIDEGPKRGHDATERLKQLTGGGPLTARQMRANPVTFEPTHTLVMTTNAEPHLTDPALRARMRLIPCDALEADVRPARIPLLGHGLLEEAPGILAALMREAAAYLADRDSAATAAAPDSIRGLAREMAEGQDPVREWVETCTVPADPGTPGRVLYGQHFAAWHQAHPLYRRMAVPTETSFGRVLTEMGFPSIKTGGRWFRALSVTPGHPGGPVLPPTPAGFMAAAGGSLAGSGGSVAGPSGQPAGIGNPSSTPVLASSSGGLAGNFHYQDSTSTETPVERITAVRAPAPATPEGAAQTRPLTSDDGPGELGLAGPATTRQGPPESDPAPSPRNVTAAETAKRADEAKISKAEARRQIAEEKRQAAVREASGPTVGLPAVVDRTGRVLAVTAAQAVELVRAAIGRAGKLDVDVETSGYPVGHPLYELRSVQLGDDVAAVVLHPVEHAETIRTLLAEAPALGAFSATADLVPLAHAGLAEAESLWDRMHDVVIPAKLADPSSTGADVDGLKQLSPAVLGTAAVSPGADEARQALFKAGKWLKQTKVDTPPEKNGWAQVETASEAMLRYAASDVLDTAALGRVLPRPAQHVYERERLAQRMTARVAHHGVRIDAEQVRALTETHRTARAEIAARITASSTIDNPGSNPQVAEALAALGAPLPRSEKTGAPSVAVAVLEPLRAAQGPVGELVNAVLDYRHHDTVLGTFLEPYRVLCEQGDGRARPTVYTLGTDTGRMSCVRPNLQQLPREGGVRACITADPGQLMIGADFSGVELRVAAALSGDANLRHLIAEEDAGRGDGLHWQIARQVWGPDATKSHRYTAKRIVFGRIYGGGIATLAAQSGITTDLAQAAVDTLDAITPGLAAWSADIRDAVRRGRTQFVSYSGRIIHMPRDYPHKAPNYAIQGTAREALVDSLVRWSQTSWGSAVLLPVHDELDVFVPQEEAEAATRELVRCMEMDLHGVRIVAEPSRPSFSWPDSV